MTPFSINSSTLSLFVAVEGSESGEVTIGGFNVVPFKSLALCPDRISCYASDNSTLISADFNIVVWTSDSLSSLFSCLDFGNDSLSMKSSTQ